MAPNSRARWAPLLLVLPALLLTLGAFVLPLLWLLSLAIRDPELADTLPRTTVLLRKWDGTGLPTEPAFAAMAQELARAEATQTIGALASRLNFEQVGARALLLRTARASLAPPYGPAMVALDHRWADNAVWRMVQQASGPLTDAYLLRALDRRRTEHGIEPLGDDRAIFLELFRRTFTISAVVTVLCVLLAYPVAQTISTLSPRWTRVGMAFVLVPFWTSILVRSVAWFILMQRNGPLNALLLALGLVDTPVQMVFTRFAVYLAMVHVLLPFAVLPMVGVMRAVDRGMLRAAASLGAPPWRVFLRVYLPLTMPGVAAGGLIVFMLSVGFYITPALVGGAGDQMISGFIAFYTNVSINWGMAAALSALLLGVTFALVAIVRRLLPGALGFR